MAPNPDRKRLRELTKRIQDLKEELARLRAERTQLRETLKAAKAPTGDASA